MQFSDISELNQFTRLPHNSCIFSHSSYIPLQNPQDLNLFPLYDILDNSLQPDPRFSCEKPIKLGRSNEKNEEILSEIQTYVNKNEIKPLEYLLWAKNHGDFSINGETVVENCNPVRNKRTVSEDCYQNLKKDKEINELEDYEEEELSENEEKKENNFESTRRRQFSKAKRYSLSIIDDDSTKKFLKKKISFEQFKGKSLLSEQIQHIPSKKLQRLSRFSISDMPKMSNCKHISVFFFGTPLSLKIPINIHSTVQEVIVMIMCFFMNAKNVDTSLMRFPWSPEAYELRILEDDDDYRPEMSFDPLEKNKKFSEYGIDSVVFCEIEGFQPTEFDETGGNLNKEIEEKFETKIKTQQTTPQLLIHINLPQINCDSYIKMDADKLVIDILPIIAKKFKLDWKKIQAFEEVSQEDEWLPLTEEQEINIEMPLSCLKRNHLKIVKKTYADDGDFSKEYSIKKMSIVNESDKMSNVSIILNDIDGPKFEEFEVQKVNIMKETKKPKILSIREYRIHLKNKEVQSNNLTNFLIKFIFINIATLSAFSSFFYLFSTEINQKNHDILIDTIKDVDYASGETLNRFQIEYENINGKNKKLLLETQENHSVAYILAKLRYLM